ncbi:alpha-amylase family glycosyl hydrolase [Algoriphagus terrigena]|uniref:alpha-amylase family glycosyl hydrolase n=1 Tax=Algoriphagus terrigena TaxID=344884 RepID=UPI0003FAF540|nr:alpha-amylase family glycosyl hydrolase [Algoriphagus terrigena]
MKPQKSNIYHVFTRLFGNKNTTNKPWGTKAENGVGKFNDFTDLALEEIRKLGITHIWYTGVLHHGVIGEFPEIGLTSDHPDVIKGRAGSPYAIRDYYQVNPDLAVDVTQRLEEFEALIERTHQHGMKVIIDIVPNHVSRYYEGRNNPAGVRDFGADDDVSVDYKKDNNFYYVTGATFQLPEPKRGYTTLGGEIHLFTDKKFEEFPAKWTGNGSRLAQPDFDDWYETAKINYGISPEGKKDFEELPSGAEFLECSSHYEFWQGKEVPNSWVKFRDITRFWLEKGVDGFRYDMAEMVPVEFWSYLNSHIKMIRPDAFLMAEVYNPSLYKDYIQKGKMDYLYDKVGLYDTLKQLIQGHGSTDLLLIVLEFSKDIERHMLHFLENHDEVRIASPEFAINPWKAMPAMVLSATVSTSPTMIYFGQEVGEPAAEMAGFGHPNRTSIFDYIGVPQHQRWMNGGKFDGGQLSANEKALRNYYSEVLNFTLKAPALTGHYQELHNVNRLQNPAYGDKAFAFARWDESQKLIVICNFSEHEGLQTALKLSQEILDIWDLSVGDREISEVMFGKKKTMLRVTEAGAEIDLDFGPLESAVFEVR